MKVETTNIFINSSIAERVEDNNLIYSIKFDTPPIIIRNKATLKIANVCHTGSGHGDEIIIFKLDGLMTDYNKYLTNDGGIPTIIATTFNTSRNLYEENDIPLIRQTINSIKLNLSTMNSDRYSLIPNSLYTIERGSTSYSIGSILYFADNTNNLLLLRVTHIAYNAGASSGPITGVETFSSVPFYTSIPVFNNIVNGSGAVLTPVLTGDKITSVTIVNGGAGYNNNQLIQFTGGGGSGACYAISGVGTGGTIANIYSLGNQGSGYTSVPTAIVKPRNISETFPTTIIPPMTSNFGVITEGIPKSLNFCISLKIEEEINE